MLKLLTTASREAFEGIIENANSNYHPINSLTSVFDFNPLTAKLFNLNFHSLEVVSRWRDPQLQASENYSDLTKWRSTILKSCWLMLRFIFTWFKSWYAMCWKKKKTNIDSTGG